MKSRHNFVFVILIVLLPLVYMLGTGCGADFAAVSTPLPAMLEGLESLSRFKTCFALTAFFLVARAVFMAFKRARNIKDGRAVATFDNAALIYETGFNALALYIVCTRTLQFDLLGDDAFIDYRYAEAWLSGSWDFNPGERVMGFTSHIHILTLALVKFLFRNVELHQLSLVLNCLLQVTGLTLLVSLVRIITDSRIIATVAGATFAFSVFEIIGSGIGKEQPLGVVLMLLALHALTAKAYNRFAWCALCVSLIRPEGIFFAAAGFFFTAFDMPGSRLEKFKRSLRIWLGPVLVYGAYHLLLLSCFGSPFPHAAIVKSQIYMRRELGYATFVELIRHIGISFIGFMPFSGIYEVGPGALYLVPAGFAALWISLRVATGSLVLRFYISVVLLVIAFYAIPDSWIFNWYLLWFTLLPLLAPSLSWGLAQGKKRIFCAAFATLVMLAQFTLYPLRQFGNLALPCPLYLYQSEWGRFYIYRDAALKVRSLANAGDCVAVTEPGLVSHFYGGEILDLGGLISHKVVACYREKPAVSRNGMLYDPPGEALEKFAPRFLLFHEGLVGTRLTEHPYFKAHYRQIGYWPLAIYKARGTRLYIHD